jgi:hypothetical protein
MAEQLINNSSDGPDTLKVAFDKVKAMFDEIYGAIAAIVAVALSADQRAAITSANSPSAANPFATIADGGGGGGGGSLVGKVITGWIELTQWTPTTKYKVYPGTTVALQSPMHGALINLAAGEFEFATPGSTSYLYCDFAGNLYFGTSIPAGNYSALTTGVGAVTRTIIPTNHFAVPPQWDFYNNFEKTDILDAADFGAVGDNLTVNLDCFTMMSRACIWMATLGNVRLSFKDGTYKIGSVAVTLPPNAILMGQSENGTIFSGLGTTGGFNLSGAENLTFSDVPLSDYSNGPSFSFLNCKFTATSNDGSLYLFYLGINAWNSDFVIRGCDFEFLNIYAALWLHLAKSAIIENCNFSGSAWHNIRIEPATAVPLGAIEVRNNHIEGGATGIFFGSNRVAPVEGILIENNTLLHQEEECISFDGFGNNPGLCPTICSGLITAATNDLNGRLRIEANMRYHDGANSDQACPTSVRSDWTEFYFTLESGSGREGVFAKIVSYDDTGFILDLYTPSSAITIGGQCGVQGGFFNCTVRSNKIYGAVGATNNYATALSIYLNVFAMIIEDNVISGCAHGINVAGGFMLSTYRVLAYNNVVKNNSFLGCNQVSPGSGDDEAIRFLSYGGVVPQFGNQFTNNTVVSGRIRLECQQNLIWEGNNINGVVLTMSHCGNVLPAADASQVGRRFMLITDDNDGNPTAITYYVCKLASGVYSWVED